MNNLSSLTDKINVAKSLDFGDIFSRSIELFKKTWLQGFLLQIFTVLVMLPLIIILYIPLITIFIAQAQSGDMGSGTYNDFFTGMSILYLLFVVVGVFILGAVAVALNAAFFKIMKTLDDGGTVSTSVFFQFLKGKYLSKTFMLMLVNVVISGIAGFLAVLVSIPTLFLSFLVFFYLVVPFSYFALVFAFNPEMNVGDIVRVSFKIGHKKWLITFGLLIVGGIIAEFVGLLLCGVGLLFTAAFVYHPVYLIYKDVIGFENDDNVEEIGNSYE